MQSLQASSYRSPTICPQIARNDLAEIFDRLLLTCMDGLSTLRPTMRRWQLLSMLLLLLSTVTSSANEPTATNRFVILRNGQVLEGRVLLLGDRYQVTLESGAEMRVTTRQVEFCADSMEQAFEMKRSELSPNSVRARLELVEWGLNHRLYEQAASELTTAMYLEPRNSKVAMLERRMRALASMSRRDTADRNPTTRVIPEMAEEPTLSAPRENRFPVQPAGFNEPDSPDRSARGPKPNTEKPPTEKSSTERAPTGARQTGAIQNNARQASGSEEKSPVETDLSAKEMDEFVQAIQPFILNRCATNNCHGSAENSEFHLIRPPPGKTLVRGLTLKNLHATLAQIDRTTPQASPLLTVPRSAHGNANSPVYSVTTESAVKRLTAWIERIANPPELSHPAALTDPPSLKPLDGQSIDLQSPPSPQSKEGSPSRLRSVADEHLLDDGDTREPRQRTSGVKNSTAAKRSSEPGFTPKDPFDPEVFNRKYHGNTEDQTPSP